MRSWYVWTSQYLVRYLGEVGFHTELEHGQKGVSDVGGWGSVHMLWGLLARQRGH